MADSEREMIDIGVTVATIRAIAGVAKEAGKITLYNDIISLQTTIMEMIGDSSKAVEDNSRLTREVVTLRERVAELERQLRQREEMVFRDEAYWRVRQGQQDEGPFCPKCFDGEGKVARMTDRGNGFTCCVVCKHCIGRPQPTRLGPVAL